MNRLLPVLCLWLCSALWHRSSAQPCPADPGYGQNTWHVLAYNGANYNNFRGYYTTDGHPVSIGTDAPAGSFEFNTCLDEWLGAGVPVTCYGTSEAPENGTLATPSNVPGYVGCTVSPNDPGGTSFVAKRQGFTPGYYRLHLYKYDDDVEVSIDVDGDGTPEASTLNPPGTCCANNIGTYGDIWAGFLGNDSRVDIASTNVVQVGNNYFYVHLIFYVDSSITPQAPLLPVTACPNQLVDLTAYDAAALGLVGAGSGIAWYYGNPDNGGQAVPDPTAAALLPLELITSTIADFSDMQGSAPGQWQYGSYFGDNYLNFVPSPTYYADSAQWGSNQPFNTPFIEMILMHPGVNDADNAVRRWVSDYTGLITISGQHFDDDPDNTQGCLGGTQGVRISVNGQVIWSANNIPNAATDYLVSVQVNAGDVVDFINDAEGLPYCDRTGFTADIFANAVYGVADDAMQTLVPVDFSVVNTPVETTVEASICPGDSLFAAGAWQTLAGNYLDTLTANSGCDSVVTTALTVLPTFSQENLIEICAGESYFAGGANQTQSGTYVDILAAENGCDSVVTTALTVLPTFSQVNMVEICAGESYFVGGANQTQSGTYVDVLAAQNGCDSVVTTELAVLPNSTATINVSICEGESYVAGGAAQNTSGIYTDTLVAANGCELIVTTNLSVLAPPMPTLIDVFVCAPQPNDTIILQTAAGCDSLIVNNYVSLAPVDTTYLEAQTCNPAELGITVEVLLTAFGCDSVLLITTNLLPPNNESIIVETCDPAELGITVDSLFDASGCLTLLTTEYILAELPQLFISTQSETCAGSGDAQIRVDSVVGGVAPYLFSLNNSVLSPVTLYWGQNSGAHTLLVEDALGCGNSSDLFIEPPTVYGLAILPFTTTILLGDSIQLDAFTNMAPIAQVSWSPAVDCGDCLNPIVAPEDDLRYVLTLSDSLGCTVSAESIIRVDKRRQIFIPNIFSPNKDGSNDAFMVFSGDNVLEIKTLQVFNRWGDLVFRRDNFQPNDSTLGWDGSFGSQDAAPEVYVYYAIIAFSDGQEVLFEGDVLLQR